MYHIAYIGLVDSHTKRNSGADDVNLVISPVGLDVVAIRRVHPRMVERGTDAILTLKLSRGTLAFLLREAVDDA